MTKAAYAKLKGWSPPYLSKPSMIDKLAPAMVSKGDGTFLIDADKADEILAREKSPAREIIKTRDNSAEDAAETETAPGEQAEKKQGYYDARTQREMVTLENQLLDLADRKGNLLSKKQTVDAVVGVAQKIREGLASRNVLLADKVSTMTDARQILIELEKSDRALLTGLSDDLMRTLHIEGAD
ncbi:MAG: hypothetical protein GC153_13045 [Alphaproteobacteria bacterium]|nr:hypothetical protein [Alphaproteobacteria bacterium]